MADACHLIGRRALCNNQFRTLDADIGRWIQQLYTSFGRCGPLVELAGEVFDGQRIGLPEEAGGRIPLGHGHIVRHHLSENGIFRLCDKFCRKAEEVIDVE